MQKKISILFSFVSFTFSSIAQTKPSTEFYLPATFVKPSNWINADKARTENLNIDTIHYLEVSIKVASKHAIPRALTLSDYLKMILGQSDFYTFLNCKQQAILQYRNYFPYLLSLLTDTTNVGLSNTDYPMLFIKGSPFLADSLINKDKLTTVAGRAGFILNELTGENFAVILPTSKVPELKKYQRLWVNWIKELKD
jgi:hypothetical protein